MLSNFAFKFNQRRYNAVVVVGISGYKNEEQLRSGNHWAKIYSGLCLPGDKICQQAPKGEKFGGLVCDFNAWAADAEVECWLVTTQGRALQVDPRLTPCDPVLTSS